MSDYNSNGWSPIIYGRTYEVDFRLLVIPRYFDRFSSNWALKYILETTQLPEKLVARPRWMSAIGTEYYLFGVTCMVRDLLPEDCQFAADSLGRPLYTFIGYVAHKNSSISFPSYGDLNLDIFRHAYANYVKQYWHVKAYEVASKTPLFSSQQELTFDPNMESKDAPLVLNGDDTKIGIWCSDRGVDLWNSLGGSIERDRELNISIGLNLPKTPNLGQTSFLNICLDRWESSQDGETILKSALKPQLKSVNKLALPPTNPANEGAETGDEDWGECGDFEFSRSPERIAVKSIEYPTLTLLEILRQSDRHQAEFPDLDRAIVESIWFYWMKQKNKLQEFSTRLSSLNPIWVADFVLDEIEQLLSLNFNPHETLQYIARALRTDVHSIRLAIEAGVDGKTQAEIENLFTPSTLNDRAANRVDRSLGFKPSQDLPPQSDRQPEDWF